MHVLEVPDTVIKFTEQGNTVLEISLLEFYYLAMTSISGVEDKKAQGEAVAAAIEQETGVRVGWAQALHMLLQSQSFFEELKKNSDPSQNSSPSTPE